MISTLLEIAWGSRANTLNQLFSFILLLILVIQLFRFIAFWDKINQWSRIFLSAKIAFDQDQTVKIKSKLDELQPPQSASAQLWVVLPPLIIMFGLIGTFVGLTLALAVIPFGGSAEEIQKGVQLALPNMGSAFWTSLTAICSAVAIRLTTMLMESMYHRRVLQSITSAHPKLIQHIEREAFLHNKPGALLRPHSLREVLWQQNLEFNRQIGRLGNEIASSIRELPFRLPTEQAFDEKESNLTSLNLNEINEPIHESNDSLTSDSASSDLTPQKMNETLINEDLLLAEMKKQTLLLEKLIQLQLRSQSAQRITRSTEEFRSLHTVLPLINDKEN